MIYQKKKRDAVLGRATEARMAARELAVTAARSALAAAGTLVLSAAAPTPSSQASVTKLREPRKRASYPPRACPKCATEFVPTGANTRLWVAPDGRGSMSPIEVTGSSVGDSLV